MIAPEAKLSPYSPIVGAPPPVLAGREMYWMDLTMGLDLLKSGKTPQGILLYGTRGVGKTAMLKQMNAEIQARENGILSAVMEVERDEDAVRSVVSKMNRTLREHKSMTKSFPKLRTAMADYVVLVEKFVERKLTGEKPEKTILTENWERLGSEFKNNNLAFVLFIDELQDVKIDELETLLFFINMTQRDNLPIMFNVAGLPNVLNNLGRARSNAERMFNCRHVGWLSTEQARHALNAPARVHGREFSAEAFDEIMALTRGYPYFLQVWASYSWTASTASVITLDDVRSITPMVMEQVVNFVHEIRLRRLTPKQRNYLLALASLPEHERTTTNLVAKLGGKASQYSKLREDLINKGIIHAPGRNELDFTVPLFDKMLLEREDSGD